ncbi:2-dehydropantoate 2-reductase [Alteromonas sp. ASW11-19]|uniref:2-dehydropantoate 2-reductase n=1 Tax=Alteromonas salexigens TaxID=2982530 RepID=A0ABT2VP69_9ALTE|nr:2-dehydropantoate 2-reductase [Alteromonas salexigens]MCU7555108.1 2-dehydropantoate 2-reductase [Alteromonas salexigens]
MRLNIVGQGAIGSLIAAQAYHTSVPCRVFTRANGPRIKVSLFQGISITLPEAFAESAKLTQNDCLLLPLKVHQLHAALKQWQPFLHPDSPVVLLHNGMGGYEAAQELGIVQPIYSVTTRQAAMKVSSRETRQTGMGESLIGRWARPGEPDAHDKSVLKLLSACLPELHWHPQVAQAFWNKLAINAVINPLTALNDIQNGGLLSPAYQQLIARLSGEIAQVISACSHPLSASELQAQIYQVARATADNYSSMHQDVAHQRPTEIAGINGYLIAQAKKKGIDVPANALLVSQIHALTQQ